MENRLTHLEELKQILSTYEVSDRARKSLQAIKLVLLVAPSGSGRNTLISKLVESGDYHYIVSDTTRSPRINNDILEVNGREYWFRSEEEVLSDLEKGELLEAEVIHNQQVSGISIRELESATDNHKISVTDVDIGGLKQILLAKPDVIAILIVPPSFGEWQRRLTSRGKLHGGEYLRRMQTAARIFEESKAIEQLHLVVNDSLEHAAQQINNIVEGQIDSTNQTTVKKLVDDLLISTKQTLAKN